MQKMAIVFVLALLMSMGIVTPVEALQNSSNSDHVITADNVSVIAETSTGKLAAIRHFKDLGTETAERSGGVKEFDTAYDPLEDTGKQQLLKIMKNPHGPTKIVDKGKKVLESIDEVAVLKKGELYFDDATQTWKGFGWYHISLKRGTVQSHADDIKDVFKLADNDNAVKDLIAEGLEKGRINDPKFPSEIIWETPSGSTHNLWIVLSDDSPGSITTAYPIPKPS